MTCELRKEYDAAYAEGQSHAANMIWQSMQHSPDSAPDWVAEEWTRPGGYVWKRGDRSVSFSPVDWGRAMK